METALDGKPKDMEALRAAFLAMRSEAAALKIENARISAENLFLGPLNKKLAHTLAKLKRLNFGPSSEKLAADQLQLALEDLEQKIANWAPNTRRRSPKSGRNELASGAPSGRRCRRIFLKWM